MHVVWVNRRADFVGGAERYIADTVGALRELGVRSSLLYEVDGWMSPEFTSLFDAAFPLVAPTRQVRELNADLVYVHQLSDESLLVPLSLSGPPVVRFFHDHKQFCPREHKYKVLGHSTCTETVGLNCYACLGVINRGERFVRLRRPGHVRA